MSILQLSTAGGSPIGRSSRLIMSAGNVEKPHGNIRIRAEQYAGRLAELGLKALTIYFDLNLKVLYINWNAQNKPHAKQNRSMLRALPSVRKRILIAPYCNVQNIVITYQTISLSSSAHPGIFPICIIIPKCEQFSLATCCDSDKK